MSNINNTEKKFWKDTVGLIGAVVAAFAIRSFIFEPFHIPSGSMISTLLIGDYLVVSKTSYGYSRYSFPFGSSVNYFNGRIMGTDPKQGEVAVFRSVIKNDTDYVKRVIGVPGDKIQMKEGILYVNDVKCPLEQIEDYVTVDDGGGVLTAPQYIETLPNGIKHRIIKKKPFGRGTYDNTPVYHVPEGHFFMMGDNRDGSDDSRAQGIVGYIPYENFVGKTQFIFFSTGGDIGIWEIWKWIKTAHYSRIFTGIN